MNDDLTPLVKEQAKRCVIFLLDIVERVDDTNASRIADDLHSAAEFIVAAKNALDGNEPSTN